MKRQNISSILTLLLISALLLTICGCKTATASTSVNVETIEFDSLLEKVGTIDMIEEQERDCVYSVTDNASIESVIKIIIEGISKEVGITQEDIGEMKTGAPENASWLFFTGSKAQMSLYINDKDMPADLVCILYEPSGDKYYGYSLNGTIYSKIKEIVHAGEKIDLNN